MFFLGPKLPKTLNFSTSVSSTYCFGHDWCGHAVSEKSRENEGILIGQTLAADSRIELEYIPAFCFVSGLCQDAALFTN